MKGDLGCKTIDELVNRYEKAHKARDIEALRPLAFWNAQWATRRGDYDPWENAICEIFRHPLTKVEYLAIPGVEQTEKVPVPAPAANFRGYLDAGAKPGQLNYKERKGHGRVNIVGGVLGKLMITVDKSVIVDPSFAVIQFEGRYYLAAEESVLFDAATSLVNGKPTTYVAEPLGNKSNLWEN
jgi:hypothetical protein